MRRREFIACASVLATCPHIVAAQDGTNKLGVLMGYRENDREALVRLTAFFQALEEIGWSESRNLHLEYQWAAGNPDQIRMQLRHWLG